MAEFNVAGEWQAIQTNAFIADFTLNPARPDGSFTGRGSHSGGSVTGLGFGSVHNDQFAFQIQWSNATEGFYAGPFDRNGQIIGVTFDVAHPDERAGWKSSKVFSRG
jgi:hypothetical protein